MEWRVQNKAIFLIAALAAILTFGYQRPAYATSTLEVLPSGEGVFIIQGTGFENAGAIDITVLYDISSLASPRVVQGGLISGALMVVNDKVPGAVRLGIIRTAPIQGNGIVATLTFDRKGSSAGKVVSLVVNKFADVNGRSLPVVARISNPPGTADDTSSSSQTEHGNRPVAAAEAPSVPALSSDVPSLGVVVSPEEKHDQAAESSGTETQPAGDVEKEPGSSSAEPKGITASLEPQKKKVQQFMSVLDRFREHRRERTAKEFLSFFDQVDANGFRQEPPVVLSDGKTKVKLFFIVPASSGASPDFALRGAKLVSLKKDPDRSNTWVIEALPRKGEYEAVLVVSQGDIMLEYPLTLAPKISLNAKAAQVTDDDFDRYLRGKRRDLNGDGKQDYLDDYLFTANFIAAKQKK